MPYRSRIAQAIGQVSFANVMNELTINRPDRMIVQVDHEDRVRIHTLEMIIATYRPDQLVDLLAPWRVSDNEAQAKLFAESLRLCVSRRHPDWSLPSPAPLYSPLGERTVRVREGGSIHADSMPAGFT